MIPDTLYHYTCRDHGRAALGRVGRLIPHRHPVLGCSLIWLTGLEDPGDGRGLGLTSAWIGCDRVEYRYRVTGAQLRHVRPWLESPARAVRARTADGRKRLAVLEMEGTAEPWHWFVSEVPLVARLA